MASPRGALVKFLELRPSLPERQIRVRGVNASDQRHQPVFRQARWRFTKQGGIRHAFGNHPFDSSSETFRRPVETALFQHAGDTASTF